MVLSLQHFVIKSPERSQLLLVQRIIYSVLTGGVRPCQASRTGSPITPHTQNKLAFRASPVRVFAQLHVTLCDPTDCSPPGSSVHGILQARMLEWGCHALLQGTFPTQGSNPRLLCLLRGRRTLQPLNHLGAQRPSPERDAKAGDRLCGLPLLQSLPNQAQALLQALGSGGPCTLRNRWRRGKSPSGAGTRLSPYLWAHADRLQLPVFLLPPMRHIFTREAERPRAPPQETHIHYLRVHVSRSVGAEGHEVRASVCT